MTVEAPVPRLRAAWPDVLGAAWRESLAQALLEFVRIRRWFRAKARAPRAARIVDVVPLGDGGASSAAFVALEISYEAGAPDVYAVPIAPSPVVAGNGAGGEHVDPVIAWLEGPGGHAERALVDGLGRRAEGSAATALMALVADGATRPGFAGVLRGESTEHALVSEARALSPKLSTGEQTNSTVVFGERAIFKLYRQLIAGPSPELELGRFLGAHPRHPPVPRVLGALTHRDAAGIDRSAGIVHELIANDGDAWSLAKRALEAYFAGVDADASARKDAAGDPSAPDTAAARVGHFGALAVTLGRRTAELHLALADVAGGANPAFAPEPLTGADRAQAASGVEVMLGRTLEALRARAGHLPAALEPTVSRLLEPASAARKQIRDLLARFRETPIEVVKTRIHGDFHLGQVLVRGDDFVIIDFEGRTVAPARRAPREELALARRRRHVAFVRLRARGRAA